MLIGIILATISWFIFKNIWLALIIFYMVTGIRKTMLWITLPPSYVPYFLKKQTIGVFILSILIWPMILISNKCDPAQGYFNDIGK